MKGLNMKRYGAYPLLAMFTALLLIVLQSYHSRSQSRPAPHAQTISPSGLAGQNESSAGTSDPAPESAGRGLPEQK